MVGHGGEEIAGYAQTALPSQIRSALRETDCLGSAPLRSISELLREVVEEFDKSIINDLKALVPNNFEELDVESLKKLVNDQESGGKVYDSCTRCMRGSTVLIALIDPGKQNLWVANLGDCQAGKSLSLC